jgi:hypothetical protein
MVLSLLGRENVYCPDLMERNRTIPFSVILSPVLSVSAVGIGVGVQGLPAGVWGVPKDLFSPLLPPQAARKMACRGFLFAKVRAYG